MKVKELILGIGIGLATLGTACAQQQDPYARPTQDECYTWAGFMENLAMARDSGVLPSVEQQKLIDYFDNIGEPDKHANHIKNAKAIIDQLYFQQGDLSPTEIKARYLRNCDQAAQQ
jgi:hypothetical protein